MQQLPPFVISNNIPGVIHQNQGHSSQILIDLSASHAPPCHPAATAFGPGSWGCREGGRAPKEALLGNLSESPHWPH